MTPTLAFDVYGTLIDPYGVRSKLDELVGEAAGGFAATWRDKQIEYLFRRGLMGEYRRFSVCTRQALDYTCDALGVTLGDDARDRLMAQYRELPAYADAAAGLEALHAAGCRNYAFSNGGPDDLEQLLASAGLTRFLDGIVSVHDVRSFKPDPEVYAHFLREAGSAPADTWLVSGNPFDVIGAQACGWCTAWVRRDEKAVFDPWNMPPRLIVSDLTELAPALGL